MTVKRNYNDQTTWEQMLNERDEKDKQIAALTKERDELKKELQESKAFADNYRWLRSEGLDCINWENLTTDTSDGGLDYAVHKARTTGKRPYTKKVTPQATPEIAPQVRKAPFRYVGDPCPCCDHGNLRIKGFSLVCNHCDLAFD